MRSLLEVGARATERASSAVNVSTVSSLDGSGSSIAYAASKAALNTLTLGLARALAPLGERRLPGLDGYAMVGERRGSGRGRHAP